MAKNKKSIFIEILLILSVFSMFIFGPLVPLILILIVLIFSYEGLMKWVILGVVGIISIGSLFFTSTIEGVTQAILFIEYLVLLIGVVLFEIICKFIKKKEN